MRWALFQSMRSSLLAYGNGLEVKPYIARAAKRDDDDLISYTLLTVNI